MNSDTCDTFLTDFMMAFEFILQHQIQDGELGKIKQELKKETSIFLNYCQKVHSTFLAGGRPKAVLPIRPIPMVFDYDHL